MEGRREGEPMSVIAESTYRDFFQHLITGDIRACDAVVDRLIADGMDVRTIYIDLFRRAMYEVGERWEGNELSVATEHMASSITESLMAKLYPQIFSTQRSGHKAVVACVANEYHQIGGKMAADILELNGWDAFFLGANTPIEDLLRLIAEKEPELLGLSLTVYFSMDSLRETIERVRAAAVDLPIVVGGQAFRWGGRDLLARYPRVEFMDSLRHFEEQLRGGRA